MTQALVIPNFDGVDFTGTIELVDNFSRRLQPYIV